MFYRANVIFHMDKNFTRQCGYGRTGRTGSAEQFFLNSPCIPFHNCHDSNGNKIYRFSKNIKKMSYLACCGPVFPVSCAELAEICESAIAPDSIPKAFLHLSVNTKKNRN